MSENAPEPPVAKTLHPDDDPILAAATARSGLWLFAVYLLIYAGFVGLNAFAPTFMARAIPGGLNLATAYGLALIVIAVLIALVYMVICRVLERRRGAGRTGQ